jgi:hypothetical protein
MAESTKQAGDTAAKNADHPQVDEILEALPQGAKDLGTDAIKAAMPSDEEQLDSDGNKHYQKATGSLPLEDKQKAVAEIVKNNLGATANADVAKRIEAEQKKIRESADRPGSDLKVDLPYGWSVSHAQEASSRQYGPDVIRTTPGHYVASKRVNNSLVEQSGETPEQLQARCWDWERTQSSGVLGA